MKRPISEIDVAVIILTFNEEANIQQAIGSVHTWAREIHVVDSYSSDRTVMLAQSFPKVRVARHAFRNYADQWNWALEHLPIAAQWILKLDADEMVSAELRDEICRELAGRDNRYVGYYVRFQLHFMGRRLRFGGLSRTWLLRLWRADRGVFETRPVNEHLILQGPAGRLRSYLIHQDRKGLSAWIWRHNRYSTMETQAYFRKGNDQLLAGPVRRRRWLRRHVWPLVPFKPTAYFVYAYFLRLGFLDGRAGYHMCKLRSIYYYLIELKKKEVRRFGFLPFQHDVRWIPAERAGSDCHPTCPRQAGLVATREPS